MNPSTSTALWLAVGLAGGILIGRGLKRCEADNPHATSKDLLAGLIGLGGKAIDYFDDDDEGSR